LLQQIAWVKSVGYAIKESKPAIIVDENDFIV
jgi:hypothetical protein